MQRRSRLDAMVERFRDRWMTDPQYRARMSAVLGALVLVALCSCMGVFAVAANAVLASGGLGGSSNNAQYNQGGGSSPIAGGPVIPTNTVPLWTPGSVPEAPPVPTTGTPPATPTLPPTPTAAPSPTPCHHCNTTPTPGGGGNGNGEVTGSPSPWTQCQNAQDKCDTVVVHTTPNISLTITVTDCAGATHPGSAGDATPPNMADGSGTASYAFAQTGPSKQSNATVVIVLFGGGPQSFALPCG